MTNRGWPSLEERFAEKVDRTGECWTWTGQRDRKGYGYLTSGPRGGVTVHRVHRLSWKIHTGEDPGERHVLHRCDNPACVRPSHLFLGDNQANVADRVAKNRTASGDHNGSRTRPEQVPRGSSHWTQRHPDAVPRGEQRPEAVISENDVKRIIEMDAGGEMSQAEIGCIFGIGQRQVSKIVNGKRWRHITGAMLPSEERKSRRAKGERHHSAKMSEQSVRELRSLHSSGGYNQFALARRFGIDQTVVSKILLGKLWSHVR